jgi:hypothetical protein
MSEEGLWKTEYFAETYVPLEGDPRSEFVKFID